MNFHDIPFVLQWTFHLDQIFQLWLQDLMAKFHKPKTLIIYIYIFKDCYKALSIHSTNVTLFGSKYLFFAF